MRLVLEKAGPSKFFGFVVMPYTALAPGTLIKITLRISPSSKILIIWMVETKFCKRWPPNWFFRVFFVIPYRLKIVY